MYNDKIKENYYITFTKEFSEFQRLAKKVLKVDIADKPNVVGGNTRVLNCPKGTIIWIWIAKKEYLIHELIHAAFYTLREKQIEISEESGEETLCYLVDWLIKKTNKLKEEKKI